MSISPITFGNYFTNIVEKIISSLKGSKNQLIFTECEFFSPILGTEVFNGKSKNY